MKWGIRVLFVSVALLGLQGVVAHATEYSSTNYKIDGVIGGSYSSAVGSTSYKLSAVGGESVVGNGTGGSYKIGGGYTARLERSLQLTLQPGGLLAYYPLDTGTGKVVYDATSTNADMPFNGTPTWNSGKIDGGIATSSGNTAGTTTNPSLSYSALSVCSWANMTSTGTTPTIISMSDSTISTNNMWSLGFSTGATTPQMSIRLAGTTYSVTSSTSLGTSTWGYICTTYDGSNLKMYLNGVSTGTTSVNQAITAPSGVGIYLGARNTSVPFTGSIDEVKIYNKALSDKEVLAEYNAQNAGITSGTYLPINPGSSQTTNYDVVVQTDAANYSLAINQNNDLTSGANTISPVSGSVASPNAWVEGTTKGLGFTLYGTNATALPGTWGSGNNYAPLPNSATTMYNRTGFTGGTKDVLNMRLRLDVPVVQPMGDYTNQMTVTGTMIP